MRISKLKILYFIVCMLSTYLGYLSNFRAGSFTSGTLDNHSRSLASEALTKVSFDKLDCPSPKKFHSLMKKINFVGGLDGEVCDRTSNKSKFGILINYISKMNTHLPDEWKGGARSAIQDPVGYLEQMSKKIDIDFSQKGSVAYNRAGKYIYLGPMFFKYGPLDSLLTLIHEGRHSSVDDPGHSRCGAGDNAQHLTSCDAWFRTDEYAGAYAYSVSFAFGLAKYSQTLSEPDREFLIANGLSTLGRRFTSVPEFLGLPFETLVALSHDNKLYFIHPILKKTIEYNYGDQLDINKIKFNRSKNGLFLVTNEGEIYSTTPFSHAKNTYKKIIKKEVFIKDMARLTWDNKNKTKSTTNNYFLDDKNRIWYISFDNDKLKYVSKLSNYQTYGVELTNLIQANKSSRYVLTQQGRLNYFKIGSGGEIAQSMFQDPRGLGWLHVDGGKLYTEMFGVNKGGELYYRSKKSIRKSIFQIPDSNFYLEPTNFRFQTNKDGVIFIQKYGNEFYLKIDLSEQGIKTRGVAFIRSFLPSKVFKLTKSVSDEIKISCNLSTKSSIDPWTNLAMGINEEHQLVFQVSDKACETMILDGKVKDYKFSGSSTNKSEKFSKIFIEIIFEDGSKKIIKPYAI